MRRVLIFSGTTEGRRLAETLADAGVPAVVCVATEYGKEVMKPLPGIVLHQGRMGQEEMQEFMGQEDFCAVVDATHPFASVVSGNIRRSAGTLGLLYLRLKRDTKPGGAGSGKQHFVSSNEACKNALLGTTGNIFLTVGSKELGVYCQDEALRSRLLVRVLPSEESLALCRKHGLSGKQILAMQGPFSEELNAALLCQYHVSHLVSKESGAAGGFFEKAAAAERLGIDFWVIGNPEEAGGLSSDEVLARLETLTGVTFPRKKKLAVSLIGMGMGNVVSLTGAARAAVEQADYVFGAKRLLACAEALRIGRGADTAYPYYLAEDILPELERIMAECSGRGAAQEPVRAAVLFSGDSGFYSGCEKLCKRFNAWKEMLPYEVSVRTEPGISSVSYFAAACGLSWQDAKIMSIHGKGGRSAWEAEVLFAARHHNKVFLLVSGAADVRAVGAVLQENGLQDCELFVGYQLSYPEERIEACTPKQCMEVQEEGLYILAILKNAAEPFYLAPQKPDAVFLRGAVPMTKEEVRELAVCKLCLTGDAVVYDIGSGTGSVAMELAGRSPGISVYAIERNAEGVSLILENRKRFGLLNVTVVPGKAPDCLDALPNPTHAFIGGSGGQLREILETLYRKNPSARVVITAVTLETLGEINEALHRLPLAEQELIQLQVSRARTAGRYQLMQAENPVWLCSLTFDGGAAGKEQL